MKRKEKRGKYIEPVPRINTSVLKKAAEKQALTAGREADGNVGNEVNYAVEHAEKTVEKAGTELARLPLKAVRRPVSAGYRIRTRRGFCYGSFTPDTDGHKDRTYYIKTKEAVRTDESIRRTGNASDSVDDAGAISDDGAIKCRYREKSIRTYESESEKNQLINAGIPHRNKIIKIESRDTVIQALEAGVKKAVEESKCVIAALAFLAVVILVFTLIMSVLASPFGMFFADDENEMLSVSDALYIVNCDFQYRLDTAESEYEFDESESRGTRASWTEVLCVYVVRYYDVYGGFELASMDDEKTELLKGVFYDMTSFSMETETRENADGEDETWLITRFSKRTAEEMAELYSFSNEKRKLLSQLLSDGYRPMFTSLIYGANAGNNIADMAATQIGQTGGEPYWSWYGYDSRVEWCAIFVSWCAEQCGYLDDGTIPKFENCQAGRRQFEQMGLDREPLCEPEKGWIAFFDWDGDDTADHVGIVEKVEGGYIYTIEGNSGDICRQKTYPIGSEQICSFAVPDYR